MGFLTRIKSLGGKWLPLAANCCLASVAAFIPVATLAQDTVGDGSTVVYAADYFTEWQPITASDMLARIPGQDAGGPGRGGPGGFSGSPTRGGRGLGRRVGAGPRALRLQ